MTTFETKREKKTEYNFNKKKRLVVEMAMYIMLRNYTVHGAVAHLGR